MSSLSLYHQRSSLTLRRRRFRRLMAEMLEDRRVLASGPSAFLHVTDGTFNDPDLNPANGFEEWSDVPAVHVAESNSFLYADQADLDPNLGTPEAPLDTFMLMYDEVALTTPLGPDDYFLVAFTTVEVNNGVEKLEHYVIHIFTDGTIIFFEDGELEHDAAGNYRVEEIEGQRGRVGFGPSPNSPIPHVIAEFEITLSSAGSLLNGAYSPDPQFWTSDPPDCTVSPLTAITDPVAQQYEAAAPNTPLRLDLVNQTLVGNINALIPDVAQQMGLNLHITSAYRPTAYQAHLYELRTKKIAATEPECAAARKVPRSASGSQCRHPAARASDKCAGCANRGGARKFQARTRRSDRCWPSRCHRRAHGTTACAIQSVGRRTRIGATGRG